MSQISLQLKKNTIKGRSKMTFWAPQLQHMGGNISICFFFFQAEEGNTGTQGDGGSGGGGGHEPHHGSHLQRGEQSHWGRRRRGPGSRKTRLPEAKAQDASRDQVIEKHFQRRNSISSTESVDRSPIYICP